jgi:hypothetical protein
MSQVSSTNVFNVVSVTHQVVTFDTFVSNRFILTTSDGGTVEVDAFSDEALTIVALPFLDVRKAVTV